jgi:phosphoribosylanthranilate isomerase
MSVKVKICGITNLDDALEAAEAGVDALGLMFHESSPRHVSLAKAASIISLVPVQVTFVGVFVDPTPEQVRQAIEQCGIDTLQFHGEETPEFLARLDLKEFFARRLMPGLLHKRFSPSERSIRTIKAFRVRDAASLADLGRYATDLWLLDSYVPGQRGGTGAKFNWDLAVQATQLGRPIVLAGGLTPDNVAEVVRKVQPYAVDVSSGVELAPGKKDRRKVRAFIRAAKGAAGK